MPNLLISDFDVGFENDKEPFLLPEKAFPILIDAYCWRGRVKKRLGFNLLNDDQLQSRLRINLGNTGASPFAGTIPGITPVVSPGRQMFSIGSVILTSNQTGAGVQNLISTDPTYSGTLNNTTGAYSITHPAIAATPVYYYPGLPVMGLPTRESTTINYEQTVAFDTQFAYINNGSGWDLLEPLPTTNWNGTNSQFFYTTNYRAAQSYDMNFYVVNFNVTDNIKYITQGTTVWTNLRPQLDTGATKFLETCKILIPFKDRLVALNTIEDETGTDRSYTNRARWSQNGDPTAAATAWLDDTIGRGGYVDAPISEDITAAQFVQNRLIVFFERSTWELVYTGNEILPFTWQQINTELGCESTFSEISFDDGIIGVGNRGIHIANPNGVQRIDQKIPDQVGQINNLNQGPERVYGIRDFNRELIFWTFPLFGASQTYPNKVLVYNYRNNTFAIFNDSFTCYGYFQKATGITWATLPFNAWLDWDEPWNAGIGQAQYPLIMAGNQQGWTFLFEETLDNDPSLMVTDVTTATATLTVPVHNLANGQYVILNTMGGLTFDVDGTTYTNDYVYQIANVTANTFTVEVPITSVLTITGTYTGGGQIKVLNNFDIKTKNFALFDDDNKNTFLNDMHILTTKTSDGEYTLNLYQDFNFNLPIAPLTGDSTVRTRPEDDDAFSENSDKIWHEVKRGLLASTFQLEFTLSDTQMRDLNIQPSNFEMHAILLDVQPTGRLK